MIKDENYLKNIPAFYNLEKETIEKLKKAGELFELKKGNMLFFEKDLVNKIYIIIRGKISIFRYSQKAQRRVIYILGDGEFINEVIFDDLPSSVNAEAFEKTLLIKYDKKELEEIMESDFQLTKNITNSMGKKVRRLYRQIKNTIPLGLDKKVAAKLWKISKDYGISCNLNGYNCRDFREECVPWTGINFSLTITYLADMLGSSRESVSRELKKMESKGYIKWEGKKLLVKREELRKFYREI
ncbi:Crp/Fnr family transcriptional regulator [uncultured Ilyobacter sp.]|uniref:Crp/Fnr family transcriptional regulator n=1 Tax=uncultured Ilyobacter sp. TaxID=544433 RepID=UPI0029F4A9EC|nr:Crp/Fnr family transcriptional regulator [uncultured Ilyobacter sp.]